MNKSIEEESADFQYEHDERRRAQRLTCATQILCSPEWARRALPYTGDAFQDALNAADALIALVDRTPAP